MVQANHIMLESYSRCWKDAVKGKQNYNLYIRAREDVGFQDKISTSLFEQMSPHSIVTSSCRVNSGINDRFAFISPDSAECYFNAPFIRYYDGNHLGGIFNTESMLKVSTHERYTLVFTIHFSFQHFSFQLPQY